MLTALAVLEAADRPMREPTDEEYAAAEDTLTVAEPMPWRGWFVPQMRWCNRPYLYTYRF